MERKLASDLPEEKRRKGISQRLSALTYLAKLIPLVLETNRVYAAAIICLRLIRSVLPLAILWVGKLIIDAVVVAVRFPYQQTKIDLWHLAALVGLEFGLAVLGDGLARLSLLLEGSLGDLLSHRLSLKVMQHAATLDLAHYEDPATYNQLERARSQALARNSLLIQLLSTGQDFVTLVTLASTLIVQLPWLLLLLVATIIPSFFGETHFAALGYSLLFERTAERRELDYLRYLGASAETAKEVQLFDLSGFLVSRYARVSEQLCTERRQIAARHGVVSTILLATGTLGYYASYAVVIYLTVVGRFSIGSLAFIAGSFRQSRDLIQRLFFSLSQVWEQGLYMSDLFAFLDLRPHITSKAAAFSVPRPIRQGLAFENVGFRYPGADRWAVRHLNLSMSIGERIGLVGENGAGKTTLLKLLMRLYDPDEGRIILDGVDLRDYDLRSVRESVAALFQDFVRYDFSLRENIGVGRLDAINDVAKVRAAACRTGVDAVAARLENGYEQLLGRRFAGGVEVSTGEWQRIALARAHMRDAQVLILDEPTASLDVQAEYKLLTQFAQLAEGRIIILVSHRLSSARIADRILVLQGGSLVEHGSHEQLTAGCGVYARLFELQARSYV